MNRTEYTYHRTGMREARGAIKRQYAYMDMADGTDVFQRQREELTLAPMRRLLQYHYYFVKLASGTDPKGFREMQERWVRDRQRIEYACRQRRKDAERMVRHNARYGQITLGVLGIGAVL